MTLSDYVSNGCAPPPDIAFPLITIAIPTYNRASLLRGCVESALSQTYPHFEIVVSNNASTDNTSSVLHEFTDARLRTINQETNIGMHRNWNACLANARGDYIIFLSDDDRIVPGLLERCVQLLRQQAHLSAVIALSNVHAASLGRTKPARVSRFHDTGIWDGTEILMDYLTDQITVAMCSVLMLTEPLRARGGLALDLPHTADVAAWAPLLFLGKIGFINEACATFSYHNTSETARLGVEIILRDGRKAADLIASMAESHVDDPQRRKKIQIEAQRHFARRGLIALSDYHRGGGRFQATINVVWRYRYELSGVSLKSVLRFLAVSLCPQPLAAQLRQLRHTIPERIA